MTSTSRQVFLALCLLAGSAPAGAADVTLQLDSVTTAHCVCDDWYCYYPNCDPAVALALAPQPPRGSGRIDLDAAAALLGGELSLEAHTRDGAAVAAWTRPVVPRSGQTFIGGQGGWDSATLVVAAFAAESVFAGTITNYSWASRPDGSLDEFAEHYSFASVPPPPPGTPPPPLCAAARRHVDEDADGEEDSRDLALAGVTNGQWGTSVDGWGRTIGDFCDHLAVTRSCKRGDYLNDEPLRRRPRDCSVELGACVPAELMPPANPPPFSGATCQGLPLFVDSDQDSEPDISDRCGSTPAGAVVDEYGCSQMEFCALQAPPVCKRADFANDEPLRKKPRDCARVHAQCVAGSR